ncbi:unnamed protein product [Sphagnum troendelagicum]
MGDAADDDDFSGEIQDIGTGQGGSIKATGGIFSVRHEEARNSGSSRCKRVLKEGKTKYYDRQQLLELVLAAQELLKNDGYEEGDARCGIQASTKFSPFMILTGRSPRLRADNYLSALTNVIDDTTNVEDTAVQLLEKVRLIASIHESVLLNVEQAQKKQKNTKMTAQLMVWSGAALMDYGEKSGGGEKGKRKACGEGWEEKEADGLEQRRVDKGA